MHCRRILTQVVLSAAVFVLLGWIPVQAAVEFFDDFSGTSLGPAWTVLHPDPANYSVSDSQLHTATLTGDLWEGTNNYTNLFLIANPLGSRDFQMTIKVNGFAPVADYQQVVLIAYDGDNNYLRAGNGQIGGRTWQVVRETAGTATHFEDGRGAAAADFFLRIIKRGNIYQLYFSLDGVTFERRNGSLAYGNGAPQYLGFIALEGSGIGAAPVPVNIEFFQVDSLPAISGEFFDDFDGSSLGPQWLVLHENVGRYFLSDSQLHTFTLTGDFVHGDNDYQNLFLIRNPWGNANFQLTLKVSGLYPVIDYQQIDLVAYDDDANMVRCGNGFIGGGRNWELGRELAGVWTPQWDPGDSAVADFYVRLVKIGNIYRQYSSTDGLTYYQRNSTLVYGNGAPQYLGLIALQGSGVTVTPVQANFDFFLLEKLSTLPPINLLLLD